MLKRIREQQQNGGIAKRQGGATRKFAPNANKVHGDEPKAKKEGADLTAVPRALHSFFKKA